MSQTRLKCPTGKQPNSPRRPSSPALDIFVAYIFRCKNLDPLINQVNVPLAYYITFHCIFLYVDLEWKIIYVGSAENTDYDQVLDSVLVGPVPAGRHMFVFQVCISSSFLMSSRFFHLPKSICFTWVCLCIISIIVCYHLTSMSISHVLIMSIVIIRDNRPCTFFHTVELT